MTTTTNTAPQSRRKLALGLTAAILAAAANEVLPIWRNAYITLADYWCVAVGYICTVRVSGCAGRETA